MPLHSWDSDPVPTREAAPSRPRRWRLAAVPLALAAVAATSAVLLQQPAPASAAADTPVVTDGANGVAETRANPLLRLMCAAEGTVNSTTPITDTPAAVDLSMNNGTITRCLTKNGGPNLSAGSITLTGSATLSCKQLGQLTGTIVVDWADANGNPAGTSTINAAGMQDVEGDPSKNEISNSLNGTVSLDSSVLPGATVTGTLFPGADITDCSSGTISSLPGSRMVMRFKL
ncbi:hypothetical protein ACIOGZ_35290 [Kitasatospora sp. NPDC088160]|uniref:hypothetical protein n=1 Tax=Kitasatospora sp. NPDC088160 TaxID=3364072 RepID=UPI0037F9CB23